MVSPALLPGLEKTAVQAVGAPAPAPPPDPTGRAPLDLYPTPDGRLAHLSGRLSFDLPRGWKAPVEAPGGATLIDADGKSGAGLAFHPEGSPDWLEPAEFKRRLRTYGSLEDSPVFETVTVGPRFGTRRRWTTHFYKGSKKTLGKDEQVLLTETILVPDLEGIYVFWFRAPKAEFAARRAGFAELLRGLRLPPPGPDAWRPPIKERRAAVPVWD